MSICIQHWILQLRVEMAVNSAAESSTNPSCRRTAMGAADTMRCPHCAGPLSKEMIGSAVGGTTSAFYAFNHVMPIVRNRITGPMWLHFLVGAPPVIVFSSACAGLAGGAVPALAQFASSSYHAAVASSPLPSSSSQDDKINKSTTSSTL